MNMLSSIDLDNATLAGSISSDPLSFFLSARVPLAFLLDWGKISLGALLETPQKEYRIVRRKEDGTFDVSAFKDPIAFIEGAHIAGLEPWGATKGEGHRITFYNALPFDYKDVTWFSMDGCTNFEDGSWVPLCLPPDELKRELTNERRRKARASKKVEAERQKRQQAIPQPPSPQAVNAELVKMQGTLSNLLDERGADDDRPGFCPALWNHIWEVETVLTCLEEEFHSSIADIDINRTHALTLASVSLMDRLAVAAGVR